MNFRGPTSLEVECLMNNRIGRNMRFKMVSENKADNFLWVEDVNT